MTLVIYGRRGFGARGRPCRCGSRVTVALGIEATVVALEGDRGFVVQERLWRWGSRANVVLCLEGNCCVVVREHLRWGLRATVALWSFECVRG